MLSRTAVDRNYLGESLNRRLPEFASSQPERTASPSAPLRCLVLQDDDQTVDIGSFDRAVDENEPFDVIVLVVRNGLQAGDRRIEQLMARSSNPAAPIIAYTKDDNPRIDVRLSDTSSASVSSALAMVQPIVNQLAQLPRIPQGADRLRSLMLQLAYTRNAPLEAKWAEGYYFLTDSGKVGKRFKSLSEAALLSLQSGNVPVTGFIGHIYEVIDRREDQGRMVVRAKSESTDQ